MSYLKWKLPSRERCKAQYGVMVDCSLHRPVYYALFLCLHIQYFMLPVLCTLGPLHTCPLCRCCNRTVLFSCFLFHKAIPHLHFLNLIFYKMTMNLKKKKKNQGNLVMSSLFALWSKSYFS